MRMSDVLVTCVLIFILILPVALIAFDIVNGVKKKERPIFELIAFFIGMVYMVIAFAIWDLPDYTKPLNVYGMANAHEPFSSDQVGAVFLFGLWGFFSYYILKFGRKKLSPLVEVFLLAGVYIGCALSVVWIFQLVCGARPQQSTEFPMYRLTVWDSPFDLIEIFCLCIVPFIYLVHAIMLMVHLVKEKARKQEQIQYKNRILQKINLGLIKGGNLFFAAIVALLPVLTVMVIILCAFGQRPDSIILAFTQTSDWILSGEIAPPPVAYDTHYLCTVSLRGHKKLVKPIRYGIRRGEKIVVNRQLCVANAFEELIMEKAPRFHKAVRNFYDTYGYPISKHINTAVSADITYLIMKPLEWIFVLVLYLFDAEPETRIAGQYLPGQLRNK